MANAYEHRLPAAYLEAPVSLDLVGCGGNGSQMLTGLARLDRSLRALGHPGFDVTAWDPDTVSDANVGRQLFSAADVGTNKAVVLTHRVNAFYGIAWKAEPRRYEHDHHGDCGIVVSCVDSRAARRQIAARLSARAWGHTYWMDLGNREADGQVVLGEITKTQSPRLPTAAELFAEIVDITRRDDDAPSCSLAEALERQELFINQAVVTQALAILWALFRFGRLTHHGAFVNLRAGRVQPLPVDPEAWSRMGYPPVSKKVARKQR